MIVKLKNIANVTAGNSAPNKDGFSKNGIPFIRASSLEFLVRGVSIDECEKIDPQFAKEKRMRLFSKGSILFAKSGMSAKMGRIYVLPKEAYVVSHLAVIITINQNTNNQFIAYYFSYRPPFNLIKDDAYPSISITDIKNVEIPLPDLETQNKIVAILDKAKSILNKREEIIKKYDELLRATFLEMFGDPVINPKKWKIDSLINYGNLKNGLNYTTDESGNKIKCIGVGNFKSFWKLTNINTLSSISLNKLPSDDYFLKNEDLLFVRSNGNKELVGRCIIAFPNNEKVTFSGFCIRYRAANNKINMTYLAHLFREPNFKKVMLQNGRGANIQNINQELLEALKIPIPNIEFQKEFASKINQFELLLEKIEKGYTLSQQLLKSLSQQVFSERIIIDVDAELEALINVIDLEKKDEENKIDTVVKDITFIQRLMDKLRDNEFENIEQYDKASYILLRIMKEQEGLVKQIFKNDKIQITLLNETAQTHY
jgi:type I restriction enzyme, S subunit